jgi:hypothetical protein
MGTVYPISKKEELLKVPTSSSINLQWLTTTTINTIMYVKYILRRTTTAKTMLSAVHIPCIKLYDPYNLQYDI